MGRVQGKVVVVTGAGSGLGRAAARLLAREGAIAIVTDINERAGRETVTEIEAAGGSAWFFRHDVALEADWLALMAAVMERHGRLDVLVNNAGIIVVKLIEEMAIEDFRRQNAINIDGVFLGLKHGIIAMKKAGRGSIINLSSVAGLTGSPYTIGYCASKGAVRLMTQSAAKEMMARKIGIRVNSVHPALIATPMKDSIAAQFGDTETLNQAVAHLQGRLGTPEEVAQGILYLASDESSFCNGSALTIDGGQTA